MRVLVVEDDLEAQRYLVKGLKEAGHVVDEAADGETGLTLALSRPYDVAIIDRMLPKLDGLRLVETLRQERNGTPVLFLSALSDVDDRIKGLRAGGDDYLTKPYAFAELLARLDALVRRARSGIGEDQGGSWRPGTRSAVTHGAAQRLCDRICSRASSGCSNI